MNLFAAADTNVTVPVKDVLTIAVAVLVPVTAMLVTLWGLVRSIHTSVVHHIKSTNGGLADVRGQVKDSTEHLSDTLRLLQDHVTHIEHTGSQERANMRETCAGARADFSRRFEHLEELE